jgi:hypothetical protein
MVLYTDNPKESTHAKELPERISTFIKVTEYKLDTQGINNPKRN